MKSIRSLATAAALVFALLSMTQTSFGQIVPFLAHGQRALYSPCTALTTATGHATHMGRITASGAVIPFPTSDPLVLDWTAVNYEMTAANGDQLFFEGGGTVQFIPLPSGMFTASWSGEFTVTGGTGRFANAGPGHAPLQVIAVNDPLNLPAECPDDVWTYSWALVGDIDLGRRHHRRRRH